ncbi:hypothetical protein ACFWZT_33195 [Streptomyces alboflavus]|uniref:hypothetical protein n=1 Tax=Streptomyces TaxID=1883 RepID=UPI0036851D12
MDQQPPEPADARHDVENDTENVVCFRCGTVADGRPPTWICSVENGARHYFCDACSRDNIRAIEGRLDSAWW